mmetsp:Transcript_22512/g.21632  ORF Transcript_22512/g.21632 Transcript_22512/m.21632 type:complete len:160 (-) Transcript_22512:257-736(-)|eukprot:CAMPEP_0197823074 /NCGR_PEP_ID=MMETSP1437-20131217/394_1 /TAXON_ID=49252 ORGANISM="Eucampia antarctica, Strain CCMP1452" /NCGR_SAMPLE_ID=MMETSP1437 /ASSEMBLY_ACC=CAM_ASM_001096 /LENGTH=159 /DNA_ID=CAMNT_0043422045 /DNA_START=71 /DNA_END=550 /DNA_ORIENTATION=+
MKTTCLIVVATLASASAFAPASNGRPATSLAEKKSFFKSVFDMDLFAPNADQNDYGARNKKTMKTSKLGGNSYVPNGLTREQYEKVRQGEVNKKAKNYQKNVAKAGKFEDYTDFYLKRGTDVKQGWKKDVNLGHKMVKTKFDWSGKAGSDADWFTPPKK